MALSTIPAAWVGREPAAIAAGLADVLVGSLHLDFAFVRLCDPNGGAAVEVTRGNAWQAFPEWLQRHLASSASFRARKSFPTLAAACSRAAVLSFPSVSMPRAVWSLRRVIAPTFPPRLTSCCSPWLRITPRQHFRRARLIHEREDAARSKSFVKPATNSEMKVAERTAELRRSEAYLAEARRLSTHGGFRLGCFSGKLYWSEETFPHLRARPSDDQPTMELRSPTGSSGRQRRVRATDHRARGAARGGS